MSGPVQVTLAPVAGFRGEGPNTLNAGIWCTDPAVEPSDAPVHPHPFLDIATWRAAFDRARVTYDDTMSALATALDAHHRTSHGRAYWEQVTGWFVRIQTDVAIDRAALLEDIAVRHPGAVFVGLDPADEERPFDTKNFAEAIRRSHLANVQVMSQIARHLGLAVEPRLLDPALKGQGLSQVFIADATSTEGLRAEPAGALKSTVVLYKTLLRKRTELPLRAWSFGKIRVVQELSAGIAPRPADEALRSWLASAPCDTDLGRLTLALVARNMPTALVEEWPDRAQALSGLKPYPKVIVTGLGSHWNSDFAIWSAAARLAGSRFVGLQHGGTYGERDACSFEAHERAVSDAYVTWGWSEGARTVALPAPRLSGIPRRHRPVTNGPILWVGTSDAPYVYQLGPRPVGPQFLNYFASQRAFDTGLDAETRPQVLFRPYPSSFGWADQPGLTGDAPGVALDDFSRGFHQRMAEARLVVVDHLGSTTMLEALSANIPVLCFGSTDDFDIRPSAQVPYDRLAAQGLYYRSAAAAAAAVNRIAADIPTWWAAPERQFAARAFADTFARRGKFLGVWRRFLSAQVNG